MNSFDRVILSCDPNPKYMDFWPIVAKAWEKLFRTEVRLAFVADACTHKNPSELFNYGHGTFLHPVDGIPIANQAKMARYWLAASLNDDKVTMINDIDLLPLSKDYVNDLLGNRSPGTLVTIGAELYRGVEKGKAMAGYLTTEAKTFRALVNPHGWEWEPWIRSFVGVKRFDSKEDISSPVDSENPDCFSDESLLRYLLWINPVPFENRRMPFWPYTEQALDRADWKFDAEKLKEGIYKEAHLPRPYSAHVDKIKPLLEYLGI